MNITLPNAAKAPINGFWLKAFAMGTVNFQDGFSNPFDALIDSGAIHTCVSEKVMCDILDKIKDGCGNRLQPAGTTKVGGVYADVYKTEPIYIIPHVFFDKLHLENVAVAVLSNSSIDCIIGRTILHRCILQLNSLKNSVTFDFVPELRSKIKLVDGLPGFSNANIYTEETGGV